MDSDGNTVGPEDAVIQTRHVLDSIKSVIEAAGGTMSDIVYNMIFLKDINDYSAMNSVYETYFQENPPARWCIRADLVKPEFLVEISSIAHVD
jgi:aminoacrylate peracid reductase